MSVVRIREGPYYRGFLYIIYGHFAGTKEIVSNREVSVLVVSVTSEREVRLYLLTRPLPHKLCLFGFIGNSFIRKDYQERKWKTLFPL